MLFFFTNKFSEVIKHQYHSNTLFVSIKQRQSFGTYNLMQSLAKHINALNNIVNYVYEFQNVISIGLYSHSNLLINYLQISTLSSNLTHRLIQKKARDQASAIIRWKKKLKRGYCN